MSGGRAGRAGRGGRAYVVFCHPTHDSFIGAALQRTLAGLERHGYEVRVSDLYAEGFRPELDLHDRRIHLVDHRSEPELRHELQGYIEHLRWCDTLILVYPTWWSGQPAMLKGWFDRVWAAGVAWELPEGHNRIRPLLRNIHTMVAVTSHGSSKLVNAMEGETGKRTMTRALRVACNVRCRTCWIAVYGIDRATPDARTRFLDRVEARMAKL
ncbi:MAG: NAD(P)H-dependent oxidoreductase [Actinomycetes bacterium]